MPPRLHPPVKSIRGRGQDSVDDFRRSDLFAAMNRILPLLVCIALMAACTTKPVNTTLGQRPETQDLRRAAYDDFVTKRTLELQQMGGQFKKDGVAREKALEEANARFGEVPADWSATWAWGKEANQAKSQAELNSQLDKLAHSKAAD